MSGACDSCSKRGWLLAKLNVRLDFKARKPSDLWPLLELSDLDLISAIGGRRRAEFREAYAAWEPPPRDHESESICKHHPSYPRSLRADSLAPHALDVGGGVDCLSRMLGEKVVAIVGTKQASDYGMETARQLARGLVASGVTVTSDLGEGIPKAVHAGVREAKRASLTVAGGGLGHRLTVEAHRPSRSQLASGCIISDYGLTDSNVGARRWWRLASARTLALIAQLVIVVEADDEPWELACASVALSRKRYVAAVPGRVSSPASKGTNRLLMNGAALVRNPQDVLDLLYGVGARPTDEPAHKPSRLCPRLAGLLERVGRGEDTIEKLVSHGSELETVAAALAELELNGTLLRGHGGRYLPSAKASGA